MSILDPVKERFHLNSSYQTHVFVDWVNYIADEFAMQKSRGGTSATATIGSFLSLEFYSIYNKLNDYLLLELLSNVMLFIINEYKLNCHDFFVASSINS